MRILKLTLTSVFALLFGLAGFIYLAPAQALSLALDLQRNGAGLTRKVIELPDGKRFVYLEGGQGEPVVLVHGFGANKDYFVDSARYLTPHYRVIIPDLIGAGESSRLPEVNYSPVSQAKYLHEFLKTLGIQRAHLGGNSMGGHISLSYAATYPGEVNSLWLLNPGGLWDAPKSEVRVQIETTGINPLLVKSIDDLRNVMTIAMVDPPWLPSPMLDVLAQDRIKNLELEKKIFNQITTDFVRDRVSGLATPALIVWGDQDRVIRVETADILHRLMPNSRVIVMPGIGHIPMMEAPDASTSDYLAFLGSL